MFEKSIFSVVATPASSTLIRFSKKKKKQTKKKTKKTTLCPVTVLVDSQVSDCCPWATCYHLDESTFISRGFRSDFYFLSHFSMKFLCANRIAPDGTPHRHLGLCYLPMLHKKDARLI